VVVCPEGGQVTALGAGGSYHEGGRKPESATAAGAGAGGALSPIAALDLTHPSAMPAARRIVGPVPAPAPGERLYPAPCHRGRAVKQPSPSNATSQAAAGQVSPDRTGTLQMQNSTATWKQQQQQEDRSRQHAGHYAADGTTPDTRSCRDQEQRGSPQQHLPGRPCKDRHPGQHPQQQQQQQQQQQEEEEICRQGPEGAAVGGAAGAGWLQGLGSRVTQWWSGAGEQHEGGSGDMAQ
jgi:hypothetical protein